MNEARRALLQAALASPLVLASSAGLAQPAAPSAARQRSLRAYVDTLIPADESPAASAVGVDAHLLAEMQANSRYHYLFSTGLKWLDQQAGTMGGPFADLGSDARHAIVVRLAGQRTSALLQLFFNRSRIDAMRAYYARPESWASLGIAAAPQPAGHLDYTRAPGDAAKALL